MFIIIILNFFNIFCNTVNKDFKSEIPPVPPRQLVIDSVNVKTVDTTLKLDTFYKKYLSADGILIVSSSNVPDEALWQARRLILQMLKKIPKVKNKLIANNVKVAVMGLNEVTTDIPEHRDLNEAYPGTNWDMRARGLGATLNRPVVSCAEENLLGYLNDRYYGEDILIHEFAHTIHVMGLNFLENEFETKLKSIYNLAREKGLWANTYAISNYGEYFAEGVQCWYNVNAEAIPSNGIHNQINTRKELKKYDPDLFNLISAYFYDDPKKISRQPGK